MPIKKIPRLERYLPLGDLELVKQNEEQIKLKRIDLEKDSEELIAKKLAINKDIKVYLNIKQELNL